jgi:ribonuclease III
MTYYPYSDAYSFHEPENTGSAAPYSPELETLSVQSAPMEPLSPERQADIAQLLDMLGLPPTTQPLLYAQALTHSSYTYETRCPTLDNYERLEFLGDAVLKLCISDMVFTRYPEYREGDLTKIRAVVVSDAVLAQVADRLQLGDYMLFGQSEARSGGARRPSNLACAFEALLGALYLDGQMPAVQALLHDLLWDVIEDVDQNKTKDNFKATLQEYTQGEGMGLPEYAVLKETGPSHKRTFYVSVSLNGALIGQGRGKSKKSAQQEAARDALIQLGFDIETASPPLET